jgi:hypothetical protein
MRATAADITANTWYTPRRRRYGGFDVSGVKDPRREPRVSCVHALRLRRRLEPVMPSGSWSTLLFAEATSHRGNDDGMRAHSGRMGACFGFP